MRAPTAVLLSLALLSTATIASAAERGDRADGWGDRGGRSHQEADRGWRDDHGGRRHFEEGGWGDRDRGHHDRWGHDGDYDRDRGCGEVAYADGRCSGGWQDRWDGPAYRHDGYGDSERWHSDLELPNPIGLVAHTAPVIGSLAVHALLLPFELLGHRH